MLVVHGAWADGRLALWAEDGTLPRESGLRSRNRPHPFAAGTDAIAKLVAAAAGAAQAEAGQLTITLPGTAKGPLPSPELDGSQVPGRLRMATWRVPALLIRPAAAPDVIDALVTSGDGAHATGDSVRYLAVVSAYARGLAGRGRALPQLVAEREQHAARWVPVLVGADAAAFRELAAAMPPVCRAIPQERPAAAVLQEVLQTLVDAAMRRLMPERLLLGARPGAASPLGERWLLALTGEEAVLDSVTPAAARQLAEPLQRWLDSARDLDGPLRVCLRLVEPPGGEADGGDPADDVGDQAGWVIEFAVQSAEDPSLYVPAELIWAGERPRGLPRHPDEALLAGLGRAARLYPELHEALRDAQPARMVVDTAWAFAFLRNGAPVLQAAGFSVQLPAWAGRKRLGLKLTTRSRPAGPGAAADQGFGMNELVDFRIDLAVGDHLISEDELAELARLKVPLVRVRGQWVELDDRQLKAALAAVEQRRSGTMTVDEVIREVVAGGAEELPLLEVDADGPLGDLLSGQDSRLTPVATPPDFAGQLRPYQERGLAWLSFLSRLGLGGILADDMGLGKCIMPDSFVFVNGTLVDARQIWQRFSGRPEPEPGGNGEWATPIRSLQTTSLDQSTGQTVTGDVVRLYRQRVQETLRRICLDDGSEITITKRHRLLGLHGWTNDLKPGDRVCVPRRLVWRGKPVDPDLTVFLAWQISEGYESRQGDLRISQKNSSVLEDLLQRIHQIADRFDLAINHPSIRPNRDISELRMCSKDYAEFLSLYGYRWGMRSANKRIPDLIMAADDATIRTFLREYFTAEGSVIRSMRSVEILSASRLLMQQLATMLRRLGIWIRVVEKSKAATNGTGIKRPYQIGTIGGTSLRLFRDLVGFSDPVKQEKLELICAKPANTNVEGIPGSDILTEAHRVTKLPQRHFGVGTVYFGGTQELSRETAAEVIQAMSRILSGDAERAYRALPRSKWTATVCVAYANLDKERLECLREELVARTQRDVHYARVMSVEDYGYDGYVYDFEVAKHHNFVANGILCHNTAQTLSLLLSERHETPPNPTLLICPMSLVTNWQKEAARFAPSLRVYVHHGAGRKRDKELADAVLGADLVITTYGTALRDLGTLTKLTWERVVCDEAQAIKNSAARQAQAVRALPARTRLALTGTPVENHLAELWSIMEFCNPGLLGSARAFRDRYQEPIENRRDEDATRALKRATGPFLLRRLKTDKSIISDLPEKLEMKVWCPLTPEQVSLYQAVVNDMMDRIDSSEGIERRGNVLAAMARLKQVCNHPAHLLKDGSRLAGRSGKLSRLEELAEEIFEEGDKALVFTQYAEFGSLLQPYLAAHLDRPVLWLHGGLPKRKRDELVERFQSEDEPMLFLLSLKAAGTGLNLTAANHVIHIDRWWNPAVEDQATDRAFRIGQTRNVQVRKFICAGTLEERIDEMIERKKALAESVVGTGEEWITDLATDQLRELFRLDPSAVT